VLLEERIPDGWEPSIRCAFLTCSLRTRARGTDNRDRRPGGLSMAAFNQYVLGIEMRIDEKRAAADVKKTA
jgi:hypothetical protein